MTNHEAAEADDIQIVVFHALVRGKVFVNQTGTNPGNFVRTDGGSDPTSADSHATLDLSACHGESEWNAKNLFTGWVDVALTEKGRAEAVRGGELLVEAHLLDFAEDLYGEPARLSFASRLRDELAFDSVDALVAQMGRDVEVTRSLLAAGG